MQRKDQIDAFGAVSLVGFSALLGFNQVVIKLVNVGLQPVFSAGLRSLGAMLLVYLWMRLRGSRPNFERSVMPSGLLSGVLFASEFILLFVALDLTSVSRTSVLFYSMPVWLTLMAHFTIPAERLTVQKSIGLLLAFTGVCLALADRGDTGQASLTGDLMALFGSFGWAGIALSARITAFSRVPPMMQIYWQLSVSSVILLIAALFFGPLIRDFQPIHGVGMAFQIIAIGTGGYMFWFWLLKIYPASGVASFGFLAPIFGVGFGWLILGETVGPSLWAALSLVAIGLILINRPPRRGASQSVK